jgi:hypothetical protein
MALQFGPLDTQVDKFEAPNKSPNVAAAFEETKKLLAQLDTRLANLEAAKLRFGSIKK